MKYIERHTFVFNYDKDKVDFIALQDELQLFRKAWPNAIVNDDKMGQVSIAYEDFSQAFTLAENAALDFRSNVSRHVWWEEL